MRHRTVLGPAALGAALGVAVLTGCSSASDPLASQTTTMPGTTPPAATSSAPAATSSAPASSAPASTPAGRELRITVTGKKVEPPPDTFEVKAGEPVRFVITSDHDDEIHLHGVEIEKPVAAGETVTIDATYTDPGSYEIEMHEPALLLVRVLVR